jgi:hypothetical protein
MSYTFFFTEIFESYCQLGFTKLNDYQHYLVLSRMNQNPHVVIRVLKEFGLPKELVYCHQD